MFLNFKKLNKIINTFQKICQNTTKIEITTTEGAMVVDTEVEEDVDQIEEENVVLQKSNMRKKSNNPKLKLSQKRLK